MLAAVMAVLIVGGAAWAAVDLRSGSAPEAATTVVFGDSVTGLSSSEITARTGAIVVAYDGAKWADLGPAVAPTLADLDRPPDRVGVLLGANDVIDLTMGTADFAPVLDPLAGVPCVVVLELPKTLGGLSRGLNKAIRAEVAKRPNMTVDDRWSVLATANLEQDDGSWFDEDKVHPNAEGQQQLAKSYASALDQQCAAAAG